MVDVADKLTYFQAITGLEDPDLCTEILSVHGWDLEQAISSFTSADNNPSVSSTPTTTTSVTGRHCRHQSSSSSSLCRSATLKSSPILLNLVAMQIFDEIGLSVFSL
ncbi:hypothetical protein CsSME_00049249 [Camellia sinensis var. sinensis]